MSVSLFLIEDQSIKNHTLEDRLENEINLDLLGCADDTKQALYQLENLDPDVILFDIADVPLSQIHAVRWMSATCPSSRVLALGTENSPGYIDHIKWCGIHGYMLKPVSNVEIVNASHVIHNRDLYKEPPTQDKNMPDRRQLQPVRNQEKLKLERTALFV